MSKPDSMICFERIASSLGEKRPPKICLLFDSHQELGGLGCLTKHRAPSPCKKKLSVAWISCTASGVAPLAAKRNLDFLTKYMGIEMKMLVF